MRRAAFLVLTIGFLGGIGWGLTAGAVDSPEPALDPPAALTAHEARAALTERARSADAGELADLPFDGFAAEGVGIGPDGNPTWGPFTLRLRRREYAFDRTTGQPPLVSHRHLRGSFEFRDGHWVAAPPQAEWQASAHE